LGDHWTRKPATAEGQRRQGGHRGIALQFSFSCISIEWIPLIDIVSFRSPSCFSTIFAMFEDSDSYKGSARVFFKNLELDRMRCIDQNKVAKLVARFKAAGCRHDDLGDSSLAVLIDFERFRESLTAAGFPQSTVHYERNSEPLVLPETIKFTLLYGDHRVLAAQKHLPAKDRWWTVHVFDSGQSVARARTAGY
jgi:hypothetical protein